MKKAIVLTAIAIMLITPGMANASFFDTSDGWWMAEDQWTKDTSGGMDINTSGSLLLNVTSTDGNTDSHAFYVSNWLVDLNHDASFTVMFDYQDPTPGGDQIGGLMLGFMSNNPSDNGNVGISGGYINGSPTYAWSWELPNDPVNGTSPESHGDVRTPGTYDFRSLYADFTADPEHPTLTLSSDEGASKTFNMDFAASGDGDNYARIFIGGGSFGGVDIGSGEAYLGAFEVAPGTTPVAPEPVSSALFLLGGAVFAARQYRKRGKKA